MIKQLFPKSLLGELWPRQSEDFHLFLFRYRFEIIMYCVTAPMFLGIPLFLLESASHSPFGIALGDSMTFIFILVPWIVIPSAIVLTFKRTWVVVTSWILYNLFFVGVWIMLFIHFHI